MVGIDHLLAPTGVQRLVVAGAVTLSGTWLVLALRPLVRRVLPPHRTKRTIDMSPVEVVNEFTHVGYRVEAMTEDTVVLVRFNLKHLFLGIPLLMALWYVSADLSTSEKVDTQVQTAVAIIVPVVSLLVAFMYTIAGYGYDRLVFHQEERGGPSTCVARADAFLPSRVDLATISTEDHGDDDWYRTHPDRL